ncbi:hypothetical protein [Actinomadura macra]|uniref:hypothetical protein n=1 Tax=Actinomadura macra TaxID=46164 RepID=UPI00082C75F0|nr:hypothetical protein [Actinomadura macra]
MSRKTDLLAALSDIRPDQLDPPADSGRLERFRAIAASGVPPRRRARRHRSGVRVPRPTRYTVAITAAAALVAGLVTVPRLAGDEPSARQVLLAAATALGNSSSDTGRYWTADLSTYTTASYVGDTPAGASTARPLYRYESTCNARLWASRSSRDTSWLIIDSVTDRRLSSADERAWRRAGAPGVRGCQIYDTSIGMRSAPPAALALQRSVRAESRDEPTYPSVAGTPIALDQIAELPTDPGALKAVLDQWWLHAASSAGSGPDAKVPTHVTVQEIADLLVSAPTPPAMQAALYRVLAGLPVNRSHGTVTDQLGRRGVAFWADNGAVDQKLIVDPRTGHPLAVEGYLAGELDSFTLVRRQGWTNALPTLPAHRL